MKTFIIAGSVLLLWALMYRAWDASTITTSSRTPPDTWENRPAYADLAEYGIPEGSTNFFRAGASIGMGGRAALFRFHAPLSNILAYVQKKLESDESVMPPLGPVKVSHPRLNHYGLHTINWFDVENITTGLVVQGPKPCSRIYVDAERELYYYMRTD